MTSHRIITARPRPSRVGSVIHRTATGLRWPLALLAWWLWWMFLPPSGTTGLTIGFGTLIIGHRLLAPEHIRLLRRRSLKARAMLLVVVGILFGSTPQVWAADGTTPWGVPTATDYCKYAPVPETSGTGITGILDPQNNLPMDGTAYGDRGYAGMFWFAYDSGCTSGISNQILGGTGSLAVGASNAATTDTTLGNYGLKAAKLELSSVTGMRARALNLNYFDGLDQIMTAGVDGLKRLLITPWLGVPLAFLALILVGKANKGDTAATAHRTLVALAGLALIAFLGNYPLAAANWADKGIVGLQNGFDQGFLSLLPDKVTPVVTHCDYDITQFDKPPVWLKGFQVVAGAPCTVAYRPTLNPKDSLTKGSDGVSRLYSPQYFQDNYFAEVMVANLIFPYWEEGLLGTDDRSGPNYDLAMQFLQGQSVTKFEQTQNNYDAATTKTAPVGTIYCTYSNNAEVCGRSETGGAPDKIMTDTEGNYRQAIQNAGDAKYPYIQGKANNRLSSGATAFAAVTAAAPPQFAAYAGVFAGRLLLRIFVFAGLVLALGLILFPKLLQRILNTLGAAAATILLLSVIGSLMSFLTLQLIANPAVFGSIGQTSGLVILAVISALIWLGLRPMRRIGAMLSTAAFNDPNALSNARRAATAPVRRVASRVLRRRTMARDLDHALDRSGRDGDNDRHYDEIQPPRPENQAAQIAMSRMQSRPQSDSYGSSRPEQRTGRMPTLENHPAPRYHPSGGSQWRPARAWSETDEPQATAPTSSSRLPAVRLNPRHHEEPTIRPADWGTPGPSTGNPATSAAERRTADVQDLRGGRSAPRSAEQTPTGAYVITDVERRDVYRPTQDPGTRRVFVPEPRPDAQQLIWHVPRPPQRRDNKTALTPAEASR